MKSRNILSYEVFMNYVYLKKILGIFLVASLINITSIILPIESIMLRSHLIKQLSILIEHFNKINAKKKPSFLCLL